MKKRSDLSALSNKIAHKSTHTSIHDRFKQADEVLGIDKILDSEARERVIRKSYALTKQDLEYMRLIQDKCLNQKIVLNDSHVIRLALMLTSSLSEEALIQASVKLPKVATGRPKGSKTKNH